MECCCDSYCHICVEWRDEARLLTIYKQDLVSALCHNCLHGASATWYLTEDILWNKSSLGTEKAAVSISLRSGFFT